MKDQKKQIELMSYPDGGKKLIPADMLSELIRLGWVRESYEAHEFNLCDEEEIDKIISDSNADTKPQYTSEKWKHEIQMFPDGSHDCLADENGDFIADFGLIGDKETLSRAKLAAAAPDMLEALKVLRVEAYKGERTDLLEIIDPVIAKAEGRGNE